MTFEELDKEARKVGFLVTEIENFIPCCFASGWGHRIKLESKGGITIEITAPDCLQAQGAALRAADHFFNNFNK